MDTFDAVIIGAGPAGLLTGIELRKKNWRVCILEKAVFPRTKVCGGFLGPENRQLLEGLGVCDDVVATGARPIRRISLVEGTGCSIRWGLREREGYGPAWGVDRSRFDHVLFEKARAAGVVLRTGAR